MSWLYMGKPIDEQDLDLSKYYGFIYKITNTRNGMIYVGRKFLTKAGTKQVKGVKKKIRKDSDWRDYYGSSPRLLKAIEAEGKDHFERKILRFCMTRSECNYYEAHWILKEDLLLREDSYNDWLKVTVSRVHMAAAGKVGKHKNAPRVVKPKNEEARRAKIRHARLGTKRSAETKEKLSANQSARKGVSKSDEWYAKRYPGKIRKV